MNAHDWSTTEQQIAQAAFKNAYNRETSTLIQDVRAKASSIARLEDLWRLHDFLSARRHEIDGKYDYSYPSLIFVFAGLLREGWLHLGDLEGLSRDKLAKITSLARM
jgi:hypothetical protein